MLSPKMIEFITGLEPSKGRRRQNLRCDGRTLISLHRRGIVAHIHHRKDGKWSFNLTARGQAYLYLRTIPKSAIRLITEK